MKLQGTLSDFKNELLFSHFNINYNNLPEMYRKGSVLLRQQVGPTSSKKACFDIRLDIERGRRRENEPC